MKGIVQNNLDNIANSKTTTNEWSDIIKKDKAIAYKTINIMAKLCIIYISDDYKDVEIYNHKLEDFREPQFEAESFKQKVNSALNYQNKIIFKIVIEN